MTYAARIYPIPTPDSLVIPRSSARTRPQMGTAHLRFASPTRPGMTLHSHRDLGLDMRVRIVAFEHEIFVAEREDVLHVRIELQGRQPPRRTRQLQPCLLEMVRIEVSVAQAMNEVAGLEVRHLRHHQRQQRIGRDVEGYAEKHVRRTLIELARQFAVRDVELKQAMAWRQRHPVDIGRIPCADDQAPRVRIAADHVDDIGDLVDAAPVRRRPGPPLRSIDPSEIAIGVGPFVPDRNAVVLEIFDVGIAFEKPQQFVHDRFQRQLLGGQHRKPGGEIEAHLLAEYRQRAGAGAVVFFRAVRENAFKQIVVLIHGVMSGSWRYVRPWRRRILAAARANRHGDSANARDYTRKMNIRLINGKGGTPCSALNSRPKADQVSDSTNTSSRFLRSDGSTPSTSRKAAVTHTPA